MVEWSKIWAKKFNKPLLNDQDWLEPSDGSFDQILKGIENPKRDKGIFWLPVLSIFLLLTFVFFIHQENQTNLKVIQSLSEIDNTLVRTADNTNASINTVSEVNSDKFEINSSTQKQVKAEDFPLTTISNQLSSSLNLIDLNQSEIIKNQSILVDPSREGISEHETTYIQSNLVFRSQNIDIAKLMVVSPYLPINHSVFDMSPSFSNAVSLLTPVTESKVKYVRIYGGVNRGIHELNSNYEFALAPADFYAEDKFGYQLGFGINQQIGERVGLTFNVSYKNQKYSSGHNSEVIYNTALEETDQSQAYELTLATPFGFVQSDFVLSRSADYQESATSLDAIFGSSHEIHALNTDVIMDYTILGNETWSISIMGGLSLAYALKIDNRLASLDTQHEFIKYVGGTIEEDQSGISKFNPSLLGGAMFKKDVGVGQFVLNMSYNHSARAFFRQQEFSSQLHSLNMDIGYQIRF